MTTYLDLDGFKALTVLPSEYADAIEDLSPGWIDAQLAQWSAHIDTRLRKRYAVPFEAPYPYAVTSWLTSIVTVRCYLRRGVDPNDLQFAEIKADCDRAMAELKEAADSVTGLFDLPLRQDTTTNGISKGGTIGYSESSPYAWMDGQASTGRDEDRNGRGTFR